MILQTLKEIIQIREKNRTVIEAKGFSHKGTIKPFDLTINKGEVIGLTGLLGSGRSELVRAIYGADRLRLEP